MLEGEDINEELEELLSDEMKELKSVVEEITASPFRAHPESSPYSFIA